MLIGTYEEEWRPAVGYEDLYEVSSYGRVRRLNATKRTPPLHIVPQNPCGVRGYLQVPLHNGEKYRLTLVSDVVTAAFLGPKPSGLEVNHVDGDTQNNQVWNLEYLTHSENVEHAWRELKTTPSRPVKLNPERVRLMRRLREQGFTIRRLAETFSVGESTARMAVNGQTWANVT